jgi:hypothetical protein
MKYLSPQLQPAGVASQLIQFKGGDGMDGTYPQHQAAMKASLEAE